MQYALLNLQSGVGVSKGYWQYLTSLWKYMLPHDDRYVQKAAEKLSDMDIILLNEVDAGSKRSID